MTKKLLSIFLLALALAGWAMGDDVRTSPYGQMLVQKGQPKKKTPTLPETKVVGEQQPTTPAPTPPTPPQPGPFSPGGPFDNNSIQGPFLPDVQGTRINAGKKTENIDLHAQPPIANNNLRQMLITVPSLLVSEETTPLNSIGYRGLNPDRAQFMMILKDGIPIAADIFGYPESYYFPPLQTIDRIDFVHGGSALMYGPQPGGALNFITKMPVTDSLGQVYTENMFGSFNFFSTYSSVSGTSDNLGYYLYYHHRESDGFRTFNSRYDLNYGGGKFVVDLTKDSRLIVGVDFYSEGHGEPGGLTRQAFDADPSTATRPFDFFQLRRYATNLIYQEVIDDGVLFEARGWWVYYSRFSRRQRGGGFGTVPTGNESDFQHQEFLNFGVEPRIRRDYCLFGNEHTFTTGIMYYHTDSPREDFRGPVQANAGDTVQRDSARQTDYLPVFAENLFRFSSWQFVPGVRLENIWQGVQENVNVAKTAAGEPLADRHVPDNVVLLGLGVVYQFTPQIEAYYNISQAYRPILFQEAVVPGANTIVSGDLQPGDSWQTDIGFRGAPTPYLTWDTSLFYLDFSNQVGTIVDALGQTVITNVGDARHRGWEFSTYVDLIGIGDELRGTDNVSQFGSFGCFYNHTVLDAIFYRGPNRGISPAFTPDYIIRGGVFYSLKAHEPCRCCDRCGGYDNRRTYSPYQARERLRIWFTGTFVDSSFGTDDANPQRFVPSYAVWDLSAEAQLFGEYLRVFGGIYNIFDEKYFARVRGSGIDPAFPRNYFAGFKALW